MMLHLEVVEHADRLDGYGVLRGGGEVRELVRLQTALSGALQGELSFVPEGLFSYGTHLTDSGSIMCRCTTNTSWIYCYTTPVAGLTTRSINK